MKVSGKPQPPKICKSSDVSTISFINLSESFWLLSEFFRKYVQEIWSNRVFPNPAINQFDQSNKIKWNQLINFSFVQESSTKFYFWMLLWLLEVLRQQTRYLSNIWRHQYFAKFKVTKIYFQRDCINVQTLRYCSYKNFSNQIVLSTLIQIQ